MLSAPTAERFWHLPVDAARHGPAMDAHLLLNLWIALALVSLAHLILLSGLIFGRRASQPVHILLLEYLPLAALTILFAGLGARSEQLWAAQRYTGADPTAMQVEVTGAQFVWTFRYPGADATFNLFSDDGNTYAYEKGSGSVTKLLWNDKTHRLNHEGAAAWSAPDKTIVEIIGH